MLPGIVLDDDKDRPGIIVDEINDCSKTRRKHSLKTNQNILIKKNIAQVSKRKIPE